MGYCLATLWHERQRFLPAVLAVAFSALLVALQCGLLLGTFSIVSLPIDHTAAHVWVTAPGVASVDVGLTIPELWLSRLSLAEVERSEVYLQSFAFWQKPGGGSELCIVVGSRQHDGALGAVHELTPELRTRLMEPGTVVVDEAELGRLGLARGLDERAEVNGRRVRVVGLVRGLKGLAGPYLFCSVETAQQLLGLPTGQVTYLLARCRPGADAAAVVARLRRYANLTAFTSTEFSWHSRLHWLFKTGAGISLGCAALLGLLVGVVITSQTLYAATAAALREFAVLRAMGVPRRRLVATVLTQALATGVLGIGLSLPVIFGLARLAALLGAKALLPPWLLAFTAAVTLAMALLAGLSALRSLRLVEPAALLR
jgi:putative ABC transport system permease protein